MKIGNRTIAHDQPPFVIAEVGANHNGDLGLAKKLVDAAVDAGADCVKFQSWTRQSLFAQAVYDKDRFLSDGRDDSRTESLEITVERYSLSRDNHFVLARYCADKGVMFASSPFSEAEVDLLVDELDVPFIKIASMDVNNVPFLEYAARKSRPIVLSTGLASLSEIAVAVDTLRNSGCRDLALLHCVAQYPPDDDALNLRNIDMLRDNFPSCPVGYSDHSRGISIPLAAIARGACIVEKHFTLDQKMPGWDHAMSATPVELATIVTEGRRVSRALGGYIRIVSAADLQMRYSFRRSIVAARPIAAGKKITRADITFKRPGSGIPPTAFAMVIGRIAQRDIAADEIIEGSAI